MNFMELDGRNAWVTILCKTVRQHLQHILTSYRVCININFAELTIRANIIHTAHVVVMSMSNEYTIYLTKRL